jgi:transcriptional regulator with XRE-family HTH domain
VNEALRNALAAKGIDRIDVAAKLQVDPKTVERWLSGRLPHPSSRIALAKLLDTDADKLWPTPGNPHARSFGPEFRAVYPHRSAVPRDVWLTHFGSAKHEIDILVYSGLFLFEDPDILQLLAEKAEAGVRIRILLANPGFRDVALHGEESAVDGRSVAARARDALAQLKPLAANDAVHVRLHRAAIYNSIFRADDTLLTNPHIYRLPTSEAPALHLRRSTDATLFPAYLASFERMWQSQPIQH